MSAFPFTEGCALPVDNDGAALNLCAFDPSEELVWSASGSGMVYSHIVPSIELYSAFRPDTVNFSPAVGLFPNPFGVVCLTHDAVRFYSKGGMALGEIRREELTGIACGCLMSSQSSSTLAVSAYGLEGNAALSIVDLSTATIKASLPLDAGPATIARHEPHSNLLCVSGADGTVLAYDVRGSGARPAGKCVLYPSKNQVVCAMDIAGNSLCASALRSQLGPLGQQEYVFDTSLKTMDIRTMRFSQDIYCAEGAASLRWYFGSTTSSAGMPILAASPSGTLHTLDSRGAMTAPSQLQLSMQQHGEQLICLDIASSSQLLCAGGSQGGICIGV